MSQHPSLSQHRLGRGWSQDQLAQASRVSRTEISAIENGRLVPSVAVAIRIAAALQESVEVLFGGDKPSAVSLAWSPQVLQDARVWRASVGGRLITYPVEATAAGTIPHDAMLTNGVLDVVTPDVRPDQTLVIAGCDPLVGLLMREMAAQHGIRVLPLLRSSTEALSLLKRGVVHVAGAHLTNPAGARANDQAVRQTLGPGYQLLHQVRWDAGIALDSRRRERTPRAVLQAKLRWVNREEGSAARRAFDTLLGSRSRPKGYDHVVTDHRSVAATVSSGWAEAGLCVRPAAAEARLSFIPLHEEAYELCVADALLDDPRVVALMAALRSVRYRRLLGDVPGCRSSQSGEQRAVA